MRQKNHAMAFRLSLSSLMAALGTVLMLSSNLIPVLTYVAPMLASLTLIPILTEFGKKYAWMTWGVTAGLPCCCVRTGRRRSSISSSAGTRF